MQVTNNGLIISIDALRELGQQPLPVRTSFAIAGTFAKVESALKVFSGERDKIVNRYAEKGEDGQMLPDGAGNVALSDPEAFLRDMNELLAIEVDVDAKPISVEQMGDITVKPTTLAALSWLIVADPL